MVTLGHVRLGVWIQLFCLVLGCGGSVAAGGPVADVPPPKEPPRIGVRALYVAYTDAQGAPSDLRRSKQEAKDRALMLGDMARMAGEDFDALVSNYSDRPTLGEPGDMGALLERGNGLLPKPAEDAAFVLEVGDVSPPVETDAGYVLVKRTQTPTGGPAQVAARHILVSYQGAQGAGPNITRTKDEARALAETVRTSALAADADWDALTEANSDEPGHAVGGDLGVFERGRMVPAFERAVFGLEVGQTSSVVETPFGFHVIQRYR
jgi:NIMA-interacting peptidyl-prolyl cis-trans isomerase 1